ncbi:MAG TPA: Flp family type IVb pilin [Gaiellaceae bacterium]
MTTFNDLIASVALRVRREEGQTMAEYGILVAVIALIAIGGATLFGGGLNSFFGSLAGNL